MMLLHYCKDMKHPAHMKNNSDSKQIVQILGTTAGIVGSIYKVPQKEAITNPLLNFLRIHNGSKVACEFHVSLLVLTMNIERKSC